MDLKTIISDSGRTGKFPTVITDEVFTVNFFNNAAEKLIPGLKSGRAFDEFATIYDKCDLKRSKYPLSSVIGCGGKKYFGIFCPVISGFFKEYVFIIAAPDGEEYDDCEQYLSMKLAVISKCIGGSSEGAPVGRERAYNKFYSSYEASMRMLAAMSGSDMPVAVNIKELLEEAFSYYETAKRGSSSVKRYYVETDAEYIKMKKSLCVLLVCIYDICQTLSRNSFCKISVNSVEKGTSFVFSVRPKHKLEVFMETSESTEEAVYSLLGREAENMLLIKTLVRQLDGQMFLNYDAAADELSFSVTVRSDGAEYVKSSGNHFGGSAHIAAQMCLAIKGKA